MKKLFALALVIALMAGGAQAQKRDNRKSGKTIPSSMVDGKGNKTFGNSVKAPEIRQLPEPVIGMDMPFKMALEQRRTIRTIREDELPIDLISSLLWSAYGINRAEESRRVVPSAVNVQEFDVYLFDRQGVYLYDAQKKALIMVAEGDYRKVISSQPFFEKAPVSIVLVANYDRMKIFKDKSVRDFYAAVDCGYISQNIYLFSASAKLATVACGGINHDELGKLLRVTNGKAMLAHPVGFAEE
jgi:SagB-type dehydrogenase family enzyme